MGTKANTPPANQLWHEKENVILCGNNINNNIFISIVWNRKFKSKSPQTGWSPLKRYIYEELHTTKLKI